eukprot:767026-Hanusia_phi.AAC.4
MKGVSPPSCSFILACLLWQSGASDVCEETRGRGQREEASARTLTSSDTIGDQEQLQNNTRPHLSSSPVCLCSSSTITGPLSAVRRE